MIRREAIRRANEQAREQRAQLIVEALVKDGLISNLQPVQNRALRLVKNRLP